MFLLNMMMGFVGGGGLSPPPVAPVAGYTLWYDANQEAYANNDPVGTITDQSGNGYNATATLTLRPTFKTGIQNSKPAYQFDGSNDVANTVAILSSLISSTAFSVFIVFNPTAINTDGADTYDNDALVSDANSYFGVHLKSTGPKVCAYNWDSNDDHVDLTISTGAAYIVHSRHESGNLYASVNNGAESSVASGNTGGLGGVLKVGSNPGTGYFDGYIMEILIYNTALSGSNIAANYAYLNGKYMIY